MTNGLTIFIYPKQLNYYWAVDVLVMCFVIS